MSACHWTEWLIRGAFAVTGLIHLLPLAGIMGRATLERAYAVKLGEGLDLVILMQHRALLFGLLAAACLLAVGKPGWRLPAGIAALISMLGFVLIAASQPHAAAVARVMWIDVAASVLLALALLMHLKAHLTSST
jgi:hypothetical protein